MNDDHLSFSFFKVKNVMSPPTCIIIPLHGNAVTKVVDPTSIPSHYSRSSCYDLRNLPFIDEEVKEGMEDDKGSYGASMHSSTLTTLNVFITSWTFVWVICFLLYFHLCPKTSVSKFSAMPSSIHFSNLHDF